MKSGMMNMKKNKKQIKRQLNLNFGWGFFAFSKIDFLFLQNKE